MNLKIELQNIDEVQAKALTKLFNKLSWSEVRINAASEDEAYQMTLAVSKLQDAMARKGYEQQ
ncbi:DUF7706 family protein [Acinetobacter modestus]|uniref:Uncharacterized protein n=1 Tax=Acinetobacter modestus TaxID=1776740 RepID=N9LX72_9GAMM|nr:hypothetical protein [Acinetobacter modestus]ENX00923.1 hypothetical protein F900_01907 [Acinetobacter modestus]